MQIYDVIVLESPQQTGAKRPARLSARHIHVYASISGLFRGCRAPVARGGDGIWIMD